ncbi:amino acid ABC transporter permease [Agrobacterium vitis]|uniref:amino acid ABC transporter permease n=1 Tax=Agrobacterium vitis TaxID=373 RepID=UPI0012E8AE47|nr:amino acid ABC transporter permease [Agrobacterium vitis]MVA34613.1 ABC transporter permease subunit [Agrobacterium vitis]
MIDIIRDNWLLLLIGQYPNGPLGGLVATLLLAILGLLLALPCALLLALGRVSPYRSLRFLSGTIVHTLRGTPFLMVIFWSYFALPFLVGQSISGFWTLVGALVLYESAYLAEVLRAGIEALPRGQTEAARSLGLSYRRTMLYIVLPQAIYNSLPSLLSQFVSLIKETSLGYVISVNEFTFAAAQVNTQLLTKPVQVFSILAATYFLLCFSLTQTARTIERRIAQRRLGMSSPRNPVTSLSNPLTTEPAP